MLKLDNRKREVFFRYTQLWKAPTPTAPVTHWPECEVVLSVKDSEHHDKGNLAVYSQSAYKKNTFQALFIFLIIVCVCQRMYKDEMLFSKFWAQDLCKYIKATL